MTGRRDQPDDQTGLPDAKGRGRIIGNPSSLAFANTKAADEHINESYATLFAVDQLVKVLLVQVIIGFAT